MMIATVGWGWVGGALLIPIGVLLVWLGNLAAGAPETAVFYLGVVLLAGLGVLGGESVFRLWRRAERRNRNKVRQARLLIDVAAQLQSAQRDHDIYQLLPRLAAEVFSLEHASVLVPTAQGDGLEVVASYNWDVPAGFKVPLTSVVGRALRLSELVYVPDVQRDPDFIAAPAAICTRSVLAIPLRVAGQATAVLNLEHRDKDGFDSSDARIFTAFAQIAGSALEQRQVLAALEQQLHERGFIARLNHRLVATQSPEQMAQSFVAELLSRLGVEIAGVLALRAGRLVPLALGGEVKESLRAQLLAGLRWSAGALYECWMTRQPHYVERRVEGAGQLLSGLRGESDPLYEVLNPTYLALQPITGMDGEVQAVLVLAGLSAPRPWPQRERRRLQDVAEAFGLALERSIVSRQLWELLAISRQLAQAEEPRQLYQAAVEAAVRLIAGAEAASLLVGGRDGFRYQGAVGYDLERLRSEVVLSLAAQRHWYGEDGEAFERGVARLLRGEEITRRSAASAADSASSAVIRKAGKVSEIRCNLCVPIMHRREVLGILNLDSFSHEGAFSRSALTLAEAYAQQVAIIIQQTQYREALQRLVVTDQLTGLGNREGFNRDFKRELALAQLYGQSLSLLLIDLDNFK